MDTALDHILESAAQFAASNREHAAEEHPDEYGAFLSMFRATSGQALTSILSGAASPMQAEAVIRTLDREALESIAYGAALARVQSVCGMGHWTWPEAGEER